MTKEERLLIKLNNHERVVLSYGNEFVRLVAIFLLIVSLLVASLAFYHFRVSVITIVVLSTLLLTYWIFFRTIKKYVAASIKGEMLIIKDLFNTNKVTSLKSIKSISSTTVLGYNYTKITFKLDGIKYSVTIVKKLENEDLENEKIIKTAMNIAC